MHRDPRQELRPLEGMGGRKRKSDRSTLGDVSRSLGKPTDQHSGAAHTKFDSEPEPEPGQKCCGWWLDWA